MLNASKNKIARRRWRLAWNGKIWGICTKAGEKKEKSAHGRVGCGQPALGLWGFVFCVLFLLWGVGGFVCCYSCCCWADAAWLLRLLPSPALPSPRSVLRAPLNLVVAFFWCFGVLVFSFLPSRATRPAASSIPDSLALLIPQTPTPPTRTCTRYYATRARLPARGEGDRETGTDRHRFPFPRLVPLPAPSHWGPPSRVRPAPLCFALDSQPTSLAPCALPSHRHTHGGSTKSTHAHSSTPPPITAKTTTSVGRWRAGASCPLRFHPTTVADAALLRSFGRTFFLLSTPWLLFSSSSPSSECRMVL